MNSLKTPWPFVSYCISIIQTALLKLNLPWSLPRWFLIILLYVIVTYRLRCSAWERQNCKLPSFPPRPLLQPYNTEWSHTFLTWDHGLLKVNSESALNFLKILHRNGAVILNILFPLLGLLLSVGIQHGVSACKDSLIELKNFLVQ